MPARATITNLFIYCRYISKVLESNTEVGTVFMDFEKIFDTVDRSDLLSKLALSGFSSGSFNRLDGCIEPIVHKW